MIWDWLYDMGENPPLFVAIPLAAFLFLLVCGATLGLFALIRRLAARLGSPPWANPVLLTAAIIAVPLLLLRQGIYGHPLVETYLGFAYPLTVLLAIAVVALALPIHRAAPLFRRHGWRLLAVVAGGALTGCGTAVVGAKLLGLDAALTLALSTKSVSSPFAITIMGQLGGSAPVAAAISIVTGIIGAILLPPLFRLLRIDDDLAIGLAVGQAAHVIGMETLLRTRPAAAPFAGLALALAGLMTALALPPLWRWLS